LKAAPSFRSAAPDDISQRRTELAVTRANRIRSERSFGNQRKGALLIEVNAVREKHMKIDATEFGSITIAGKTYDHDVVIRLSEKVEKRKKKLSKRIYGTSHAVSEDEARFVFEKGCKVLVFGTGQDGQAALSPEAADFFKKKGCKVVAEPTPDAIRIFNAFKKAKIGLFHVTC
jgi:hypothetical protein